MMLIHLLKRSALLAVLILPLVHSEDHLYHNVFTTTNHANHQHNGQQSTSSVAMRRRRRWHKELHSVVTGASSSSSSSAPWRPPSSSSSSSSRMTRPPVRDYSSHFLDFDEARSDKRARHWQVDLKSRRPGRLSLTSRIIWANIIMYGLQVWRPGITNWGVKRSDLILQGRELYRLFSPVWLHANPGHLFTNMFSLGRMGNDVERLFGKGRYIATYLAAGVTGNLVSAYMSPNPGLGASGAVFGMVGAYVIFLSRHDWLLGRSGEDMNSRLMQTIILNVGLGMINPVIDNWAHIGGAVGGAAMAYFIGPRLYLTDVPHGGRLVVDRPILRLPRHIESIPETIGDKWQRIMRRMHVIRYQKDLKDQPWRAAPNQQPKRDAPNRSIKPGPVD